MEDVLTLERAALLDAADPLSRFRARFHIPQHAGKDCIYLCGNSLGLQPVGAAEAIAVELEDWARLGVEGHFHARNRSSSARSGEVKRPSDWAMARCNRMGQR